MLCKQENELQMIIVIVKLRTVDLKFINVVYDKVTIIWKRKNRYTRYELLNECQRGKLSIGLIKAMNQIGSECDYYANCVS